MSKHRTCADCTARYARRTEWRTGTCRHDSTAVLRPLTRDDLSVPEESADRSPQVDIATLSQLHVEGRTLYSRLTRRKPWGVPEDLASVVSTYVRDPWGGVTLSPEGIVKTVGGGYAVTIRPRVATPVREDIGHGQGWRVYSALTEVWTRAPFIGVFRDDERGTIDIDPVAIVPNLRQAQALGVYCQSEGGAYCFADGLGYWTPTLQGD